MFTILQKIGTLRLFQRTEHLELPWQIILWWEKRRILFNLVVGAAGIFTCMVLFGLELLLKNNVLDNLLPNPPAIAIFGYGIFANMCFTGGWMAELLAGAIFKEKSKCFGEISFFLGMAFSVALTLFPILIYLLIVVTHG